MLACIACSKEGGDDTAARADTPRAVKSLGSQIKDMVLKFSGSSRHCKGGATSSAAAASYRHHRSGYRDADDAAVSDGGSHYAYLRGGSSSSTPAWDFTNIAGTDDGARRANDDVAADENNGEAKEWTALVEPGVQITFMSLPGGSGNDLKRIRFSREMFNKWQAQRWWGENFDRIMELYNVQRFSRQALPTPPRSDDGERESIYSRMGSSTRESPAATPPFGRTNKTAHRPPTASSSRAPGGAAGGGYLPSVPDPSEHILPHHLFHHHHAAVAAAATANAASSSGVGKPGESSSIDASRTTTSSRDEAPSISISNASDADVTEWVEQDEPGVYITIRELPDGTRELRRVRFSRERFGEVHAKLWWEDNRERIQAQYL